LATAGCGGGCFDGGLSILSSLDENPNFDLSADPGKLDLYGGGLFQAL